ncbi:MAG: hypothetical protein MPF33_11200 [Candidatus Aramenus sp.]|jgi:hypothetical protein|nr:hypothetical protein [Candidatus Aramenus sp.]
MAQQYYLVNRVKNWEKEVIEKTLEAPIGGNAFYLEVPKNPMAYVSGTKGVIYVNGSSEVDAITYTLDDIKNKFKQFITALARSLGKNPALG